MRAGDRYQICKPPANNVVHDNRDNSAGFEVRFTVARLVAKNPKERCRKHPTKAVHKAYKARAVVCTKQLQDEAKQRLNDWVERNKNSQDGKDVKKLLDKL